MTKVVTDENPSAEIFTRGEVVQAASKAILSRLIEEELERLSWETEEMFRVSGQLSGDDR
jgi:hypothetical protein